MDKARLTQLGLEVRGEGESLEATLVLTEPLENPVGGRQVERVSFQVQGEQLVPVDPPEVVGLRPIALGSVQGAREVEAEVADAFNEHLFHVQRRSAELRALGLSPEVEPVSLRLSTHLSEHGLALTLVADRQGNFQVSSAVRDGQALSVPQGHTFELSEFRERGALVGYLAALFGEQGPAEAARTRPEASEGVVGFSEVVRAFGEGALVPPRSGLELLVLLEVEGRPYRFAAARVAGRTFRGLLAGAQGKVWAERFELDEFPGVVPLVAGLLKVPAEAVKLIGPGARQE
ncbi:hypothetical protein JQX13_40965 [Archangium violaceum]|uniref:hypothetical protein n=1 Tax=Archangium violaceum TaxID=83451 RepID=UPI00193C6F2E|nr:hypothetical protein [Archangium violaceum]QRK14033.1 hypothetical protein JQX13_40965 [Archangium violaceum]